MEYMKRRKVYLIKKIGFKNFNIFEKYMKRRRVYFSNQHFICTPFKSFFFEQIVKMLGQQWNKLHYLSLGIINLDKKGHISSLNGSNI